MKYTTENKVVCVLGRMAVQKIVIDLRGTLFKIHIRNLRKRDCSLLDKIAEIVLNENSEPELLESEVKHISESIEHVVVDIDQNTITIEFDHTPLLFHFILDYYISGCIHLPHGFCAKMLALELSFWRLDEAVLGTCCWGKFKEDQEKHNTLKIVQKEWGVDNMSNVRVENVHMDKRDLMTCREKVNQFLEVPRSSTGARVYSWFMVIIVVISVTGVTLETLQELRESLHDAVPGDEPSNITNTSERKLEQIFKNTRPVLWLRIVDGVVITSILTDFFLHFFASANRKHFLFNPFNLIDLVVVIPSIVVFSCNMAGSRIGYTHALIEAIYILNIIRVFRVLRMFRIMTHYKSLRVFFWAWKTSYQELVLLLVIIFLFCSIYGSLVFYVEIVHDNFLNIPEGLWWAVVTMTTVGYGDMYPVSVGGYVVGTACAITGLVVVAMPVPIIVQNFGRFYYAVQTCERLKKKQTQMKGLNNNNDGGAGCKNPDQSN